MRKTTPFEKIRGGKFFILLGAAEYVVFVKGIESKKVKISGPKGPKTKKNRGFVLYFMQKLCVYQVWEEVLTVR